MLNSVRILLCRKLQRWVEGGHHVVVKCFFVNFRSRVLFFPSPFSFSSLSSLSHSHRCDVSFSSWEVCNDCDCYIRMPGLRCDRHDQVGRTGTGGPSVFSGEWTIWIPIMHWARLRNSGLPLFHKPEDRENIFSRNSHLRKWTLKKTRGQMRVRVTPEWAPGHRLGHNPSVTELAERSVRNTDINETEHKYNFYILLYSMLFFTLL